MSLFAIIFAGTPAINTLSTSNDLVTTELAPTQTLLPILISPHITAPEPIKQLSPIIGHFPFSWPITTLEFIRQYAPI